MEGFFLFALGNQFRDHRIFRGLVVFGGVLDIDLPAGQTGCKTNILTFTTDGQTQLIRWNQHVGMLTNGIDKSHHIHARRTEGVGDVLRWVLRPADHVDFFAPQFVHNLLDA